MKRLVLWLLVMLFYTSAGAQDFKAYRGTVPGSYNFWFHDPEGGSHKDPKAHFPLLLWAHQCRGQGTEHRQLYSGSADQ